MQRDKVFSKPNALKIAQGLNPGLADGVLRSSNQGSLGGLQDQQPQVWAREPGCPLLLG